MLRFLGSSSLFNHDFITFGLIITMKNHDFITTLIMGVFFCHVFWIHLWNTRSRFVHPQLSVTNFRPYPRMDFAGKSHVLLGSPPQSGFFTWWEEHVLDLVWLLAISSEDKDPSHLPMASIISFPAKNHGNGSKISKSLTGLTAKFTAKVDGWF